MSLCSREKVELSFRTLTRKPKDNQSNRIIFANAAFLLFLNSQSNTTLSALLFFPFQVCPVPVPIPIPVPVAKRTSGNPP